MRGCTALLDAVGQAIKKIDNVQKHLTEEHKAGKVLFVIATDGLENSSEEYSYNDIRRLIETKKECGWEFLFLGANIDAGKEAEKIGIARDRSVTYENDSKGVSLNYETVSKTVSKVTKSRACRVEVMMTGQRILRNIMLRQGKVGDLYDKCKRNEKILRDNGYEYQRCKGSHFMYSNGHIR